MPLAPGWVIWAELSWITGPACAGAAQPAARQVPAASTAAAVFLATPPPRRAGGLAATGVDAVVRADARVLSMMTDLI
jgi:hypothetical protein